MENVAVKEPNKPVISQLKAFELKNFMVFKEARVEFDSSGILTLVGFNDSGKTAVKTGLEMLLDNTNQHDANTYIRDDEEYFGLGAEFSDGVEFNKYKYADGKTVIEFKRDGEMVYTNKKPDGAILAIAEYPEFILNYLGMIRDDVTGESFNFRSINDKLLLVKTTGGENYKMLNYVLRSTELSKTSQRINEDINVKKTTLTSTNVTMLNAKATYDSIFVLEDEALNSFKENSEKLESNIQQLEYLYSLKEAKQNLADFVSYDEVLVIDTSALIALQSLVALKTSCDTPIIPECNLVDISRYEALKELLVLSAELSKPVLPECQHVDFSRLLELHELLRLRELTNVVAQPICPPVDFSRMLELKELLTMRESIVAVNDSISSIDTELSQINGSLQEISTKYNYKICQTCGTVVV